VAAYESFDPSQPFKSRQLVDNLNRIWSDELLEGERDSPELRRAREMRPAVAAADHILDIHSTSQDVQPFWVYPDFKRNADTALTIGRPAVHLVMPQGLGSGTPLVQHGRHGLRDGAGTALVVECGQHFRRASGELAVQVALDFIAHFGLIDPRPVSGGRQQRFQLMQTCLVKTPGFRFARPLVGFEVFGLGELIAVDGEEEIRAPCGDCTVLMPTREPVVGREGMYLAQPLAD
jgi:hypothetical protein